MAKINSAELETMTIDEICELAPHQLNIAIAKRKGWDIDADYPHERTQQPTAFLVRTQNGAIEVERMPDYCNDSRAAMKLLIEKRLCLYPVIDGWKSGEQYGYVIFGKTPEMAIARAWLVLSRSNGQQGVKSNDN